MELHHLHLKGCTVSVPFWSFPGLHCVTVPCAASRYHQGCTVLRSPALLRDHHQGCTVLRSPALLRDLHQGCTVLRSPAPLRDHHQGCTVLRSPCAASTTSSPGSHSLGPLCRIADVVISRIALSRSPVPHRRRRHLQGRTVQVPCAASPTSSSPGSHSLGLLCRIADVVISRIALSRCPVLHTSPPSSPTTL
ncbi:hypothetical protein Zmor_001072 [Zophobas morio]|uniref:Uncharacterized protein n=1 Tax=Zophobas morio TaxID=2755281 RepID=A0AA38J1U2_9CUCU|nr:hypothetical protein Zmor_001072 [Zophobas morio]